MGRRLLVRESFAHVLGPESLPECMGSVLCPCPISSPASLPPAHRALHGRYLLRLDQRARGRCAGDMHSPESTTRDERPGDESGIDRLLRAAFGGDVEARLVDQLRRANRISISRAALIAD